MHDHEHQGSRRRRGRAWRAAAIGVALGSVASPTAVWAVATFSDVPPEHTFYDDISAIADAGVSVGYPDGTYRPGVGVTRAQMAGFMRRGFGRVAADESTSEVNVNGILTANGGTGTAPVRSVTIDAGATGGGGGYVQAIGTLSVFTSEEAQCPCRVSIRLTDGVTSSPPIYQTLGSDAQENGWATASLAVSSVFTVAADTSTTVHLELSVLDANLAVLRETSSLSAVYIPFDGTGVGLG
jgi:hypothetical protein